MMTILKNPKHHHENRNISHEAFGYLPEKISIKNLFVEEDGQDSQTPQSSNKNNCSATNIILNSSCFNSEEFHCSGFNECDTNNIEKPNTTKSENFSNLPRGSSRDLIESSSKNDENTNHMIFTEDPIKLLLMAAETKLNESSARATGICCPDGTKCVLPSIKEVNCQPFFHLSKHLSLPHGLPLPSQMQYNLERKEINCYSINPNPDNEILSGRLRDSIPVGDLLSFPPSSDYKAIISSKSFSKKSRKNLKYECTHLGCTKTFPSLPRLRRHLLIHSCLKPFVCPYNGCGRKFSRRDNMMQHAKAHISQTKKSKKIEKVE